MAAADAPERWQLATEIADQVQRRYPADVAAIGVHGSLAHRDNREGSDIEMVVVTFRPGAGPVPTSRQLNGWIVDLNVISGEEYLRHARTLTTGWPLAADQYLNAAPIVDEKAWFQRLRDTHLARLAEASSRDFTALARESWCTAQSLYLRAMRHTEWFDTDGALITIGEARTAAAITDGLLTRTYFRSSAEAGRQTGIGGADMQQLGVRLKQQAEQLAARGRPVGGSISDIFR